MTDDLSGQTVKGYDITERIGTGSFGAVYRAIQPSVGREVAIKIILPDYANRPEFVRRFDTEARLVARLEHPHIVPLFDYWREPDRAYIVMRLLPRNLRAQIVDNGPLPVQEIITLVDQIASALAISHRHGVVHRDIKPDNILLDDQGNAYLTDFGLAEVIQSSVSQEDQGITGSPAYMSPEQLKGQSVTPQSDIYALGIVIYEMLTGAHPFGIESNISDLIRRHLLELLPPITTYNPQFNEATDYVIQRATNKDIDARYQDVLALANDLRSALSGEKTFVFTGPYDKDTRNPYKGLLAFEEVDAAYFFGREKLIGNLLDKLHDDQALARFLAVVGPSGSGKSSLIYAGVVPALRSGALPGSNRWFVTTMVPSTNPLSELESALLSVAVKPVDHLQDQLRTDSRGLVTAVQQVLTDTDNDLLLIIDQFEEVFTLVPDETERVQFLNLLYTATIDPHSRLHIIVTLRADFYDRPLLYDTFGALMQARTHIVLPLSESELERAIVAPAQRVGVQIEPNLTAAIIADVRAEPGALPLMQYALTEVFERRDGQIMTLEGYEDIGRAAGALARRAERVYMRLTDQQQAITQQLFLRLVTLGEGTEDVRRRANRVELLSAVDDPVQLENVLDIFGRHRLLSFDHEPATREPTVEVAHEALLREWTRLRGWLDDSREDVRQQRRLAGLANEWRHAGQDPSFLLRGAQLEHIEFWLENTIIALTDHERTFINASIAIRQQQKAAEKARLEREAALEARARRFQRRLIGVMFVALVIAVVLVFIAIEQSLEAQDARRDAEDNANIAQAEAAGAATAAAIAELRAEELQSLALVADAERAYGENSYDLALALAVEANRIPHSPVDAQRLLSELGANAARRVYIGHTDSVNTVALSPDGVHLLSGSDNGTLIYWDIAASAPLNSWAGHENRVRSVAFLPGGQQAISGGDDGLLKLWDVETGELVRTFSGHDDDIFATATHPDGTQILSGSRDRTAILWDVASGEIVRRFGNAAEKHDQRVTSVAFSPDGNLIITGSADNTLILWDTESGAFIAQMTAHRDTINDVAFSPDGTQILSASSDNTLILWNAASASMITRLEGHTERVSSVAFSPDGRRAISGAGNPFAGISSDNSLILWNLFLAQPERHYVGHQLFVSDVAFSPDGHFMVSASADRTLRQWSTIYDLELVRYVTPETPYDAAAFDTAHHIAWVARSDSSIERQTLNPGAPIGEQVIFASDAHTGTITAMALSPDGTRLISASTDRTLVLWDISTYTALYTLTGHTQTVTSVAFSPDGTRAISGSQDRTVILWDVTSGEALRTFEARHTNIIQAVAFSPDGQYALSGALDATVILWDVTTGTAKSIFRGHDDGVHAVTFNTDGTRAISGSRDKTAIVWDVTTGAILQRLGAAGKGHTDWITAVAFSDDGTRALTGSRDRTVFLWDIATGSIVRHDQGHGGTIIQVGFSPGSTYSFSTCDEGATRLWPADQAGLLAWTTTHRYVRELTCEEQVRYRLGECKETAQAGDALSTPPAAD